MSYDPLEVEIRLRDICEDIEKKSSLSMRETISFIKENRVDLIGLNTDEVYDRIRPLWPKGGLAVYDDELDVWVHYPDPEDILGDVFGYADIRYAKETGIGHIRANKYGYEWVDKPLTADSRYLDLLLEEFQQFHLPEPSWGDESPEDIAQGLEEAEEFFSNPIAYYGMFNYGE